jgi:hypothetical protein
MQDYIFRQLFSPLAIRRRKRPRSRRDLIATRHRLSTVEDPADRAQVKFACGRPVFYRFC